MNDTTSAAPSAECRAEFEVWAKSHDLAYKSSDPAAMWTWAAWQAAWNRRAPQPVAREPLTDEQCDAAAKKLAECMDYPWGHMPEQGRKHMREYARSVVAAAIGISEGDSHA